MSELKNIKYLAKGKRGVVYTAKYKNKKVAVKTKNPESNAVGRIKNEAQTLKLLNKHNIGPKLLKFGASNIIYGFVEGDFILDFIEKNSKDRILKALKDVLNQLHIMDKLKINKEEMHHPLKHIIVNKKNRAVLIDFERAYKTEKPHNATQFCQFLININKMLSKKGITIKKDEMIKLAKKYKKEYNIKPVLKYIAQ